jgi:hypothetical protein
MIVDLPEFVVLAAGEYGGELELPRRDDHHDRPLC